MKNLHIVAVEYAKQFDNDYQERAEEDFTAGAIYVLENIASEIDTLNEMEKYIIDSQMGLNVEPLTITMLESWVQGIKGVLQ